MTARGDGAIVLLHTWPDPVAPALAEIVRAPARAPGCASSASTSSTSTRGLGSVASPRPAVAASARVSDPRAAVLAVDGGNSKTDLALVSRSGVLLALVNGPTISHQQVPIETGMERLRGFVSRARRSAGVSGPIQIGSFCLAGADFPRDVRLLRDAIGAQDVASRDRGPQRRLRRPARRLTVRAGAWS